MLGFLDLKCGNFNFFEFYRIKLIYKRLGGEK